MDISLPRDLSQANINDVFDDIRNQVESQMDNLGESPIEIPIVIEKQSLINRIKRNENPIFEWIFVGDFWTSQ